jgi:hypothetical protein
MENPVYKLYFTDRSEGQPDYITWRPNPIPMAIAQNILLEANPKTSKLEAEEVLELVEVWYRSKGQEVPEDERKSCLEAIVVEREERDNPKPVVYEPSPPPKAEYGTPAFWKDYWARRKAAEAAGLPWPPPKGKKANAKAAKN